MERKIQSIDAASVARICSGQVVVDLASVVKELVENALDAHATSVDIRLKNHGAELIEVTDNGDGITPDNYEGIARKYHTSKLETFDDLNSVATFGFRGEALSSICELSESFSVTTKTQAQQIGTALEFSKSGAITTQRPIARSNGTTVSVVGLFETLPVRRAEYVRNIKKQFGKMMKLLQAYAIIAVGVRFSCVNMNGTQRQSVLATQVGKRLEDNITCTFGAQFRSSLMPLKVDVNLEELTQGSSEEPTATQVAEDQPEESVKVGTSASLNTFAAFSQPSLLETDAGLLSPVLEQAKESTASSEVQPIRGKVSIEGFVAKVGVSAGRSDSDRQFLYLNGRPVDLPKATRAVNEVWRKHESKAKPSFVLNFKVPAGMFDVNVTPDKREIVLVEESRILERLRSVLENLYNETHHTSSLTQDTPKLSQLSFAPSAAAWLANATQRTSLSQAAGANNDILVPPATPSLSQSQRSVSSSPRAEFPLSPDLGSPSHSTQSTTISPSPPFGGAKATSWVSQSEKALLETASNAAAARASTQTSILGESPAKTANGKRPQVSPPRVRLVITDDDDVDDDDFDDDAAEVPMLAEPSLGAETANTAAMDSKASRSSKRKATTATVSSSCSSSSSSLTAAQQSEHMPPPAKQAKQAPKPTTSDFSFAPASALKQFRTNFVQAGGQLEGPSKPDVPAECSTKTTSMEEAAAALSKILTKQDFNEMRILGQFNLGFVIAELRGDLFILDQHACDEKFNYELFQRTTTLHGQPLIQPLPTNASASEEITIIDNMQVFEQNGFRFHVDDEKDPGNRLYLTAVPFSKRVQFGVKDVHELASIVAQHGVDTTAKGMRLPKVSAMFASRACRQAVMIGTALQRPEMERIVRNMSTMEHPWNCPHGRPTLRHLVDLESLRQSTKRDLLEQDIL